MDVLPESRLCGNCSNHKPNNMSLYFINPYQAIYICESCDDIYPDDGSLIGVDVSDQPLKQSDLEQIGLPVELLSHFPDMRLDLANKIIRVINDRWRKRLNTLWQDFVVFNDKINREGDSSRKMEYESKDGVPNSGLNDEFLFNLSGISETELKEITSALDMIEKKVRVDLVNNKTDEDTEEVCSIGTDDFFKKYQDDMIKVSSKKRTTSNKTKVYVNKKKDMRQELSHLRQVEKMVLMRNVKLETAILHSKYPKFYDYILHGTQLSCSSTDLLPVRITKDTLSKMLDGSKF